MLVYDITDVESFEGINTWLVEIEKNAPKDVYKVLIGNKCDMENNRKVTVEQGKEFAEQHNMKFFETSAKESKNVNEVFIDMTKEILKKSGTKPINPKTTNNKPTVIKPKDGKNIAKKGCC